MAERPRPSLISFGFKLRLIIAMLTLVIMVGRYLSYVIFTFASVNLTLAILDFTIWANFVFGVVNTLLAIGGFILTGQLLQRRNISKPEHLARRRRQIMTERTAVVQPWTNALSTNEKELRDQEAA